MDSKSTLELWTTSRLRLAGSEIHGDFQNVEFYTNQPPKKFQIYITVFFFLENWHKSNRVEKLTFCLLLPTIAFRISQIASHCWFWSSEFNFSINGFSRSATLRSSEEYGELIFLLENCFFDFRIHDKFRKVDNFFGKSTTFEKSSSVSENFTQFEKIKVFTTENEKNVSFVQK